MQWGLASFLHGTIPYCIFALGGWSFRFKARCLDACGVQCITMFLSDRPLPRSNIYGYWPPVQPAIHLLRYFLTIFSFHSGGLLLAIDRSHKNRFIWEVCQSGHYMHVLFEVAWLHGCSNLEQTKPLVRCFLSLVTVLCFIHILYLKTAVYIDCFEQSFENIVDRYGLFSLCRISLHKHRFPEAQEIDPSTPWLWTQSDSKCVGRLISVIPKIAHICQPVGGNAQAEPIHNLLNICITYKM